MPQKQAGVAIFLPTLAGGGAERAMATVASGLADRGVPVELLLARAEGPYLSQLHAAVQVRDLHARSATQALLPLARVLRQSQPAVLLSAMSHANIVASLAHRLAGSRARLVLSERVNLSALYEQSQDWRLRLTRHLMRWTYPRADCLVAVSQGVADDLLQHVAVPADRVLAIPNPVVDATLLAQAQQAPQHPWLLDGSTPVVLAAGRLTPQKDFATLIDAFASLERGRSLRLLILGEGPERPALLQRAQALGVADRVSLPGFVANPFAAMRAASLFVLSSRYEGLPGVLIQAMACGTRVVSTDCPSGPREVLHGGRWGRLVPVGDAAALAAAMAAALDDPAPPDVKARAADYAEARAVELYARALGVA